MKFDSAGDSAQSSGFQDIFSLSGGNLRMISALCQKMSSHPSKPQDMLSLHQNRNTVNKLWINGQIKLHMIYATRLRLAAGKDNKDKNKTTSETRQRMDKKNQLSPCPMLHFPKYISTSHWVRLV